ENRGAVNDGEGDDLRGPDDGYRARLGSVQRHDGVRLVQRAGGWRSSGASAASGSPLLVRVARMTTGLLYGPAAPAAKWTRKAAVIFPSGPSTGSALTPRR